MPSFKTAGKSKEDLSLVAQLAGLLTADETQEMTRTQLVRFLEKENEKVERSEHPVPDAEPEPVRVRKPRSRIVRDPVDAGSSAAGTDTGSTAPAVASAAAVAAAVEPVIIELPMEPTVRRTPGRKKKTPVSESLSDAAITQPALPLVEPVAKETATDQKKTVRRISRASIRSDATVPTEAATSDAGPESDAGSEQIENTAVTAMASQATMAAQAAIELPNASLTEPTATVQDEVHSATFAEQSATESVQQPTDELTQQAVTGEKRELSSETTELPVRTPAKRGGPGRRKAVQAVEPVPAATEEIKVRKKPGRKPGSGRKQKTLNDDGQVVLPGTTETAVHTGPIQAPDRITRRSPGRKSRREPVDLSVAAGQARGSDKAVSETASADASQIKADGLAQSTERTQTDRRAASDERQKAVEHLKKADPAKSASLPDATELSPEAAGAADEQSLPEMNEQTLTAADQQNMRTEQDARNLSQTRSEMNRHGISPQNARSRTGFQRTRPLTPGQNSPDTRRDQDRTRSGQPTEPRAGMNDSERLRRETRLPGAAPGVNNATGRLSGTVSDHRLVTEPTVRNLNDQPGLADQDRAEELAETAAATAVRTADPAVRPDGEMLRDRRTIAETGEPQGGVLEIMPDGYGFLRKDNYLQGNKDIYVPPQYIRRFGLRQGDYITGPVRLQRETDRYQALLYIKDVNGQSPEKMLHRPHFDRLTPIYPDERFVLETVRNELSTRIIDLVAPIGKGQRGMIVSPPKAGKTILLQKIANAISVNNPDTKLIVLLIDERPEEVTDMQRSINGEVVYSTFDKTPENHTKVVELVLERAMRLVELKQDVIILLDSMTRLARAYNLTINPTGRTLSGGLDPGALYGPKRFFGAARNIENGGSLTIIATSLIETGSRMDEVIFEEFKGTGNMEVYLDRKLSEKRIFPAIDINKSGTRREELLMNTKELDAVWTIRKAFSQLDTSAVTEAIINLLLKTKNNEHFISSVNVSFNDKNVFDAMRGVRPGTQGAQSGSAGSGERTNPGSNPGGYGYGGSYNNTGYGSNYRRTGSNDDD